VRGIHMNVRTDELFAHANHSGQVVEEFRAMEEDFKFIEAFIRDLRERAKGFTPPRERHGLRINAHIPVENPVEKLAVFEHKLRHALSNVDAAINLAKQRREAIAALLLGS
jgi:hypothetical protein